jgi:hypothetical protein
VILFAERASLPPVTHFHFNLICFGIEIVNFPDPATGASVTVNVVDRYAKTTLFEAAVIAVFLTPGTDVSVAKLTISTFLLLRSPR